MPDLEGIADRTIRLYQQFSSDCRRYSADEVRTGAYAHLRSPGTKGPRDIANLDYKLRVNFRGANIQIKRTGERRLIVGREEAVIVLNVPFNDETNYLSGFNLSHPESSIRIVLGRYFGYGQLLDIIQDHLDFLRAEIGKPLQEGNYLKFVKRILEIMDSSLFAFLEEYQTKPDY